MKKKEASQSKGSTSSYNYASQRTRMKPRAADLKR